MTRLEAFDFDLPGELIAQEPVSPRDHCRLMVIDRLNRTMTHRRFDQIVEVLDPGDCLVLNDTRVLPARFRAAKAGTGGSVEILFLEKQEQWWLCLLNSSRRLREGLHLELPENHAVNWRIAGRNTDGWLLEPGFPLTEEPAVFTRYGKTPTPPYVRRSDIPLTDYQTVYARHDGSVAAPTAGLHFTRHLLKAIRQQGVSVFFLTLRVGPGTFLPIKSPVIEEHHMHGEWFQLDQETVDHIVETRRRGSRVVAVGTTVVRVLETVHQRHGSLRADQGTTDLFITPGFSFQAVDALVTNFHLPRSTLYLLVNAFCGVDLAREAYQTAIRERYRFYSFGDACFFL